MRKKLILLSAILFANALFSYQRVIVQHQRDTSKNACEFAGIKLEELWSGYSLLSLSGHNGNVGASQDLSTAGSCIEQFHPNINYTCNSKECIYGKNTSRSSYLVKKDIGTKQTLEFNSTNESTIKNLVSKCSVCTGNYFILVKHSFQSSVPSCDSGYTSLWNGYSLALNVDRIRAESPQSLSDTGSCLPNFVPHPSMECDAANNKFTCSYNSGKRGTLWLASLADTASPSSANLYPSRDNISNFKRNESPYQSNIPRISRCNVCAKKIL